MRICNETTEAIVLSLVWKVHGAFANYLATAGGTAPLAGSANQNNVRTTFQNHPPIRIIVTKIRAVERAVRTASEWISEKR